MLIAAHSGTLKTVDNFIAAPYCLGGRFQRKHIFLQIGHTEKIVGSARCKHKGIVWQCLIASMHFASRHIDTLYFSVMERTSSAGFRKHFTAKRKRNIRWLEARCRHLIEKRREAVIVVTVDHGHIPHILVNFLGKAEAAETTSDYHKSFLFI